MIQEALENLTTAILMQMGRQPASFYVSLHPVMFRALEAELKERGLPPGFKPGPSRIKKLSIHNGITRLDVYEYGEVFIRITPVDENGQPIFF